MRTLTLCLFAAIGLAFGLSASPVWAGPALSSCQVPGGSEVVKCGRVIVPENWDRPGGRTIALNVIVLPKLAPGPEQAPMVWLDGGPGIAGTNSAALYTNVLKFHRERRAVVMFDQRGTGQSAALHCPKIERQSPLADLWARADVIACRRALEAHADLTQYSTIAAARDLDAVRSALGYDQVDLAALSYGTMLAQTYLQRYTTHVRSAALIGTVPLGEKLPLHHSANAEHALRNVFEDCEMDVDCEAAFPRLPQAWAELQRRLSMSPTVIKVGRDAVAVRIGPFDEFIRDMLNTPGGQRRLPLIISRAAKGDYGLVAKAAGAQGPEPGAEGLYLSVACPEATRRIREREIAPAVAGSSFGRYRVDQQIAACRLWAPSSPHRAPPPQKTLNTPVLLLSGGRDATTPTEWAKRVSTELPNSDVVVLEHLTHLPVGLTNIDCLDRIMDAFFAKASARFLDTSCRLTMRPPPFAISPPDP